MGKRAAETSVTRFGEISSIWQIFFNIFGNLCRVNSVIGKSLNVIWEIFLLFGKILILLMAKY